MSELFKKSDIVRRRRMGPEVPLAERIRPTSLDDFVGQEHLLGEGKPIRIMIESGELASMIFWGPPGSGKTTLARIIADASEAEFYQLNAVAAGVKDVRSVIARAEINEKQYKKRTILFIDEIHRFNKAQQDALLHSVEDGTIVLIGATTENPSFEVISPLLSRCRVYVLEPLTPAHLRRILNRALALDPILQKQKLVVESFDALIHYAGGDARVMLNGLELAIQLAKPDRDGIKHITKSILDEAFQRKYVLYDKGGEEHYNTISAFIKSLRGSDPDAAVYWLARMLEGGEDPKFIARRMIILASEDIGNADPYALTLATSAFTAVDSVGMPEARIILSQAATYLASAPKSNASYLAIERALHDVKNLPAEAVPLHLRNAPTQLMEELGYGEDYKYAHNYEGHFVEQSYLPEGLADKIYYEPTEQGAEKKLKERLEQLWKKRRKNSNR